MFDITQIKSLIASHDLPVETKNSLLSIIDDTSITDDQKQELIWSKLSMSKADLDNKINDELAPIFAEAEAEMEQAENDYKMELSEIEKETEEVYNETAAELAALPEED